MAKFSYWVECALPGKLGQLRGAVEVLWDSATETLTWKLHCIGKSTRLSFLQSEFAQ